MFYIFAYCSGLKIVVLPNQLRIIKANFTTINDGNVYYQMSIKSEGQGKVSYGTTDVTNGQQSFDVKEGTDVVLTLTPNDGYKIASVTVNGEDRTAYVVNGQLTISNLSANTTVSISFGVAGEFTKVVIGADRMATLCPLADVDFSTLNLKAYIGSGFNRLTGVLTLTRVYDAPAGEGLLLKGVTAATNVSTTEGGYVNYVLSNGSQGVGFYKVGSAGASLEAGKAYLQIPAETAAGSRSSWKLRFDDEEEATGIEDSRLTTDGAVYDLQGRKVSEPKKGLYIRDGRKVVIK